MALTITYRRDAKAARINGRLALSSVEPVAIQSDGGDALADGTLCLHFSKSGAAVAEWPIVDGACQADTRSAALVAIFATRAAWACADLLMRVRDADGNLLGAGQCPVVNSCGSDEGADGFPASGGPLTVEAAVEIEAGCPCRISGGLAVPCVSADAAAFAGIALNHAAEGESVQICRWGAAHVADWGLTPGTNYYLPLSGQALTDTPPDIVLMTGYAQDADTLVLTGGRLAVQTRPAGSTGGVWVLVWDADNRRFTEQQLSDVVAAGVTEALAARLENLEPLDAPTDNETITWLNEILALLKGG